MKAAGGSQAARNWSLGRPDYIQQSRTKSLKRAALIYRASHSNPHRFQIELGNWQNTTRDLGERDHLGSLSAEEGGWRRRACRERPRMLTGRIYTGGERSTRRRMLRGWGPTEGAREEDAAGGRGRWRRRWALLRRPGDRGGEEEGKGGCHSALPSRLIYAAYGIR